VEVTHPGHLSRQLLGCGDSGNFLETVPSESQEEGVATATEPVLRGLKDSATLKVLVLYLYGEVHHGVNHVLKLVSTSHLSGLVHLSDDDSVAVVLLAVVSDHGQGTLSALAVGVTIGILTVIQTLEAIDDEEEGLLGVSLAKLVSVLQQRRNMVFLAGDEAIPKAEAFTYQLDLEEAFLSSVEEAYRARLGELISQGEHHGSLTRPRLTGEEGYRRRGKALTAQRTVDIAKSGLMLVPELLRDLEVQDVCAKCDVVAYVKFHEFFLGLGVMRSIPHQHIYYTISRGNLHVFDSFFAIILAILPRYKLHHRATDPHIPSDGVGHLPYVLPSR